VPAEIIEELFEVVHPQAPAAREPVR